MSNVWMPLRILKHTAKFLLQIPTPSTCEQSLISSTFTNLSVKLANPLFELGFLWLLIEISYSFVNQLSFSGEVLKQGANRIRLWQYISTSDRRQRWRSLVKKLFCNSSHGERKTVALRVKKRRQAWGGVSEDTAMERGEHRLMNVRGAKLK